MSKLEERKAFIESLIISDDMNNMIEDSNSDNDNIIEIKKKNIRF